MVRHTHAQTVQQVVEVIPAAEQTLEIRQQCFFQALESGAALQHRSRHREFLQLAVKLGKKFIISDRRQRDAAQQLGIVRTEPDVRQSLAKRRLVQAELASQRRQWRIGRSLTQPRHRTLLSIETP